MDFSQLVLVGGVLAAVIAAIALFLAVASRAERLRRWWRRLTANRSICGKCIDPPCEECQELMAW